jgi:hypothetical protein
MSSLIYKVGRRIGLTARKCLVLVGRFPCCHLPTMDVKTWLFCFPYSNQGLTRQRVIPFPIELRSLQAGSQFSASRE